MEEKQTQKLNNWLQTPTPAKSAGMAYTMGATFPTCIMFLLTLVLTLLGYTKVENFTKTNLYLYLAYLCTPIAFLLIALIIFSLLYGTRRLQKPKKCAPKYYLIAALMQIGLFGLSELNSLFLQFLSQFGYQDPGISLPSMDGFGFVGVLLVIAVLPAVFEELIFRGVLLNGLKSFGEAGAILLCGGLFALYHQNPAQTLYQFCCGAAYAWVAFRAGSILPTVIAHFINNAAILTLYKCGVTTIPIPAFIAIVSISAVALIGAIIWLIFFDKKEKKLLTETDKVERKNFWLASACGIAVCALSWISTLFSGM